MKNSVYTTAIAAFIPQVKRDDANAYLNALGFGPDNFSVECANPAGTIIMYGLSMPDDGKMQTALTTTQPLPDGEAWEDYGLTTAKVNAVVSSVHTDTENRGLHEASEHFDTVAGNNGVSRK